MVRLCSSAYFVSFSYSSFVILKLTFFFFGDSAFGLPILATCMHLLHNLQPLYFSHYKKSRTFCGTKTLFLYIQSESFQICLKNVTIYQHQLIQFINGFCFFCHLFKFTLTHTVHFCSFFISNKPFPIYSLLQFYCLLSCKR